jgi:thiosulfate reductase cytochrome b subunit
MATLGSAGVPLQSSVAAATSDTPVPTHIARHSLLVRITHWIITLSFFALLITGAEILISHPRFYWGETGNDLTPTLFRIPIPASRHLVPTGYKFTLPDQNGWSRALHFQAAWVVVLTGLLYGMYGFVSGHFRKHLLPRKPDFSWRSISTDIVRHLRFARPTEADAHSYNLLQRFAYLFVIFVLFPVVIWTGLAMSPAFTSAFPATVTWLGGRQSARTIHFFVSVALLLFLIVHVIMIFVAGFGPRMRAMVTGAMITGHAPLAGDSTRVEDEV